MIKKGKLFTLIFLITPILSGCIFNNHSQSRSYSSIAAYLYPEKTRRSADVTVKSSIPKLKIPLNIGIAFVPESCGTYKRFNLDENLKTELMENIASKFRVLDIIDKIEIIPSGHLRRMGGFGNLNKIKQAFNVDVIVLLSYDQVQYTDQNFMSLVYYYTVLGRYIFNGDENDTATLINATVYDIDSQKLLFQALGNSKVKGEAKRAYLIEELRNDSYKGFKLAIKRSIVNLDSNLEKFKNKIKEKPEEVQITYRRSYSGGGFTNSIYTLLVFIFMSIIWFKSRVKLD